MPLVKYVTFSISASIFLFLLSQFSFNLIENKLNCAKLFYNHRFFDYIFNEMPIKFYNLKRKKNGTQE